MQSTTVYLSYGSFPFSAFRANSSLISFLSIQASLSRFVLFLCQATVAPRKSRLSLYETIQFFFRTDHLLSSSIFFFSHPPTQTDAKLAALDGPSTTETASQLLFLPELHIQFSLVLQLSLISTPQTTLRINRQLLWQYLGLCIERCLRALRLRPLV